MEAKDTLRKLEAAKYLILCFPITQQSLAMMLQKWKYRRGRNHMKS